MLAAVYAGIRGSAAEVCLQDINASGLISTREFIEGRMLLDTAVGAIATNVSHAVVQLPFSCCGRGETHAVEELAQRRGTSQAAARTVARVPCIPTVQCVKCVTANHQAVGSERSKE